MVEKKNTSKTQDHRTIIGRSNKRVNQNGQASYQMNGSVSQGEKLWQTCKWVQILWNTALFRYKSNFTFVITYSTL